MITELGAMSPSKGMFGIIPMYLLPRLLTATAIGTGSALGVGPGLTIRLGALPLTTMAAGTISQAAGAGARARSLVLRSTALPLWVSSAAAGASAPVLAGAAASAGSRLDLVNRSSPGSLAGRVSSP